MKKAAFFVFFFACIVMAFAEKPAARQSVTQFLTASDIDAFLRNHKAIKADLATQGFSEQDFGFDFTITPDFDTMNLLNSIKAPPAADAIFAKYGMGKNGVRKVFVMKWATEVAMLERSVQAESASAEGMDVSMLGPIFENMKKCINPEDRRLVLARCDELSAIFSEEEAIFGASDPEISSCSDNESDEEDEVLEDGDSYEDE